MFILPFGHHTLLTNISNSVPSHYFLTLFC
jgi:hypothetical protein